MREIISALLQSVCLVWLEILACVGASLAKASSPDQIGPLCFAGGLVDVYYNALEPELYRMFTFRKSYNPMKHGFCTEFE